MEEVYFAVSPKGLRQYCHLKSCLVALGSLNLAGGISNISFKVAVQP